MYAEMHDLFNAIISDPILQWAEIKKCFYLKANTYAKGNGNSLPQHDDDDSSLAAMCREINEDNYEFELTHSSPLK